MLVVNILWGGQHALSPDELWPWKEVPELGSHSNPGPGLGLRATRGLRRKACLEGLRPAHCSLPSKERGAGLCPAGRPLAFSGSPSCAWGSKESIHREGYLGSASICAKMGEGGGREGPFKAVARPCLACDPEKKRAGVRPSREKGAAVWEKLERGSRRQKGRRGEPGPSGRRPALGGRGRGAPLPWPPAAERPPWSGSVGRLLSAALPLRLMSW